MKIKNKLDIAIQAQKHLLKRAGIFSRGKIRKKIAALEGARDALTTCITSTSDVESAVDKNNYQSYSSQVQKAYDMYNAKNDYGAELLRGILQIMVAFIAGEGISVIASNKATENYIEDFLKKNKLHGSKLIENTEIGQLEGKDLLRLSPYKNRFTDSFVKVTTYAWRTYNYDVFFRDDELVRVEYTDKDTEKTVNIPGNRAVYVKLGGSQDRTNDTPSKLHCVLTQIENASRTAYDLRKNTHLFGKIMPYFDTSRCDNEKLAADSINQDINNGDFEVGLSYAGSAGFSLVEPKGGAANQAERDLLVSLRFISTTTGIPIHWLAWPEVLSNRATAETLIEVINAATAKERLVWQEAYTELIEKSRVIAIDAGIADNSILGDFEVRLPLVSTSNIEQLTKTFLPLREAKIISTATMRNMIPGINPSVEKKQIEKETKENIKNSPFNNGVADNQLGDLQEKDNEEAGNNKPVQ